MGWKDTLCSDRKQFLDLAGAAGKRLGHHEQQVCVFYPLGVKQPDRERENGSVLRVGNDTDRQTDEQTDRQTWSSFHSPAKC